MEIPNFDSIPVNTITAIISVNINMDIKEILSFLPVVEYKTVPKKRGRKKKDEVVQDTTPILPNGTIITIEPPNSSQNMRGSRIKKKKERGICSNGSDYFRNALTIVMVMDNKFINFKMSKNGFQFTGCKTETQAINCVQVIWEHIKNTELYMFADENVKKLTCVLIPAMRNINFFIGYKIDRSKLNDFINSETEFRSLFDSTTGYTGVNIKIPHKNPISELRIQKFSYSNKHKRWHKPTYIMYGEYLNQLSQKEREKKISKQREHTFLVFHSGKVIMSSLCADVARDVYYDFMNILIGRKEQFIEKLDEDFSSSSEEESDK